MQRCLGASRSPPCVPLCGQMPCSCSRGLSHALMHPAPSVCAAAATAEQVATTHEQLYRKGLAAGLQGPGDYSEVLLVRADFLRHAAFPTLADGDAATASSPAALEALRAHFQEATALMAQYWPDHLDRCGVLVLTSGACCVPAWCCCWAHRHCAAVDHAHVEVDSWAWIPAPWGTGIVHPSTSSGGAPAVQEGPCVQMRHHSCWWLALCRSLSLPGYWTHCEGRLAGDAAAAAEVWEAVLKGPLGR